MSQPGVPLLVGREAKRIVMNGAQGFENLRALAKKAQDDHHVQLADYIRDRADQLFEEARIRELESSGTGPF
jgi:hypothetical protein